MKLKQTILTKLSAKQRLIARAGAFCLLLAICLVVIINLSDNREARAAVSGDYRTKASGDWNNASTWEKYNGSAWVTATNAPTSSDGVIEIAIGHSVIVTSNATADQLVIDEGGMLTNSLGTFIVTNGSGTDITVNGIWFINSPVIINNSAAVVIPGLAFCESDAALTIGSSAAITINNYGLFEKDGGTITDNPGNWIVNNGGAYRHNTDGGALPSATWAAGSDCQVTGIVFTAPTNLNQTFSNFSWSCASQTGKLNFNDALKTVNGDFRMTSTGTGSIKLSSSVLNETLSIAGNYYQDGGKIYVTESGSWNVNVLGSFNMTAGSIIMIDADASAGTGNPSISVAGNTNISGGLIDMSRFTCDLPGSGIGTMTLLGNLIHTGGTIISTSTGTGYGIINFSKNGTQTFSGEGSFGNKVDVNVNDGATLYLGNKTITGGRNFTLANGGGLIIGDANGITAAVSLRGNIQMPGTRTFNEGGNYTYNGTAAQVTGNGIPSSVNNLTVNNPYSVILSKSVTVNNTLTMTAGNIRTLSDTLGLGYNNSNAGTMVQTTATISGWFKRWITTNAAADYLFPVSYNSNSRGVNLKYTSSPSSGGYITVHYTPSDPGTLGLPLNDAGTSITDVGHEGYWNIKAESRLNGGTCNIDINADNYIGIPDYTKLHVVRRANTESSWTLTGTHTVSTGSKNNPVTHRLAIDGEAYGEFAIAGSAFNPAPIELISFDAKPAGSMVKLTWVTANEINNDYFTTEHSDDGINFFPMKDIDGAGNSSSVLYYNSADEKPYTGINYYRLKQTDFDNNYSYSPIKIVRFDKSQTQDFVVIESIFPNPFVDGFAMNYSSMMDATINLTLVNCWGQIFKKEKLKAVKGINTYEFVENKNLTVGVYYVRLTMDKIVVTKKILKSS